MIGTVVKTLINCWTQTFKHSKTLTHELVHQRPALDDTVADDPVPRWHSSDPVDAPRHRSKECANRGSVFSMEVFARELNWRTKPEPRTCGATWAPPHAPPLWWRGRLVKGSDKTNKLGQNYIWQRTKRISAWGGWGVVVGRAGGTGASRRTLTRVHTHTGRLAKKHNLRSSFDVKHDCVFSSYLFLQ